MPWTSDDRPEVTRAWNNERRACLWKHWERVEKKVDEVLKIVRESKCAHAKSRVGPKLVGASQAFMV